MDPKKPVIYGVNHSPWVQGVLMAFHLRGEEVQLLSCPPSIGSYRAGGMVMPLIRWPDGTVKWDSFAIMDELARRTSGPALGKGLEQPHQGELERLFLAYALDRAGGWKTFRFARAWARMPRGNGPFRASCFRSFMFVYFLILILVGRSLSRKKGRQADPSEHLRQTLAPWVSRLTHQPFLNGESPGFLDCALLGHVQCMVTGLTDHTIPVLKEEPALIQWIDRMQKALKGYPHSFLARIEDPAQRPAEASGADTLLFWISLLALVLLFPLTLMVLADAFRRRGNNTARSGAKIPS